MRRWMLWIVVAALTVGLVVPATATPGRMIFAGCTPMKTGPAIFVADPDGNDPVRLLWQPSEPPGCMREPDWSPDGQRLVLMYRCQLAVMDLWPLLYYPWYHEPAVIHECGSDPKWSPSGDRIAFVKSDALCLINPDGSGFREVSSGPWARWYGLSWTADGLGLVCKDGNWATEGDLYHVTDLDNPGGATVTQLTNTPDIAEKAPVMSPDGTELAYGEGPAVHGYTWPDPLPPAGIRAADWPSLGTVRVLTDDPAYHDVPQSWSPEGDYIYFVRGPSADHPWPWQLWRVKADGSEPAEPLPGLIGWDTVASACFLKQGAYGTSAYTLPGYTNVPFSVEVVGVENLAGLQTTLRFKDCWCNVIKTMDSCEKGSMIDHWAIVGPNIDQDAGTVKVISYAPNPELDKVTGTGELLNLTATMTMYEDLALWEGMEPVLGASAVFPDALKLSDDWGEPIEMPVVTGGLVLKPFSYLEFSEVPAGVWADDLDPEPFTLTITARGDVDELLPWANREIQLFVEMPADSGWPMPRLYQDIITPTSVILTGGTWSGQVSILGPIREPARLLGRYGDWGGRSNDFTTLVKCDINADGSGSV